jgi:hypothetical protein
MNIALSYSFNRVRKKYKIGYVKTDEFYIVMDDYPVTPLSIETYLGIDCLVFEHYLTDKDINFTCDFNDLNSAYRFETKEDVVKALEIIFYVLISGRK